MVQKIVLVFSISAALLCGLPEVFIPSFIRQPGDRAVRYASKVLASISSIDWTRHFRSQWLMLASLMGVVILLIIDCATANQTSVAPVYVRAGLLSIPLLLCAACAVWLGRSDGVVSFVMRATVAVMIATFVVERISFYLATYWIEDTDDAIVAGLVYAGLRLSLTPVLTLFFVFAMSPFVAARIADTSLFVAQQTLARCLTDKSGPFMPLCRITGVIIAIAVLLIGYVHPTS
jgi:hypothetical protein